MFFMSGVLLDLAPFPRFKKRKKRPWKSDTFNNAVGFSLTLLHFFNWDSLHTRLNSQPLQGTELQEKEAQKD